MPVQGTVLVVEPDRREQERVGEALEDAGFDVIRCPGPAAPEYTCIGARGGTCPLLDDADVVVLNTRLTGDELGFGTSSDELLELYATRGRTVIALGPGGWLRDPFASPRVVGLEEHADEWEIVAAVRTAPEADRTLGQLD